MLTLLSLVTCVCVHWGLNPTIGSRALLFFFSFYYSSLLVEPFPSHSLLASKCNTRLNQTPHFFLSIDDEGRQNKKKKTAPVDTGSYTLKKETVNSLVYFRLVVAMIFFYSFSPTFLFSRLFFLPGAFYWNGCIYTRAWESKQEASLLLILSSSWPFLVETAEKKRKKNGRIRDGWKVKGERGRDKGIKSLGIWEELFQNAPQSSSPSSSSCAALQVSGRERSITK